ncbi:head maturation protease, ClpP-related [Microbulbifer spongiae]|uniref:head maturation protease, ClpP-related n=1 Tax=Microbulbifer spongiae TaxID=2944933 RepID=UPI00264A1DF2|nr:head maturation protease, ClpP-related [Microbulbifer sp. MI-G]
MYDYIGYWEITAKEFARELKALGNIHKINLHINCPGGDVFDGTAIYNLLKEHSAEVETWIEGIAASMGSVIALAGDTVHIAENAYYMVHNPSIAARGTSAPWKKPRVCWPRSKPPWSVCIAHAPACPTPKSARSWMKSAGTPGQKR